MNNSVDQFVVRSKNQLKMHAFFYFFVPFFLQVFTSNFQEPVVVVQRQLDMYNLQDLEEFSLTFSQEVKLYKSIEDTVPFVSGRAELKAVYGNMFQKYPNNKSILKGRMVQGNYVFDHEYLTGREEPITIMAIYEVVDGLIVRAWFVR